MDREGRDLRARLVSVAAAVLVAAGAIVFVKKVLVPVVPSSGKHGIWMLECFVLLTIVGAFYYQEVMDGMEKVLRVIVGTTSPSSTAPEVHRISPFVLFLSLAASIAIYLAAQTWIDAGIPAPNS